MRKRFYFKLFSNLYTILEKKGWLVDKGKSTTPRVKYLRTINAYEDWRGNRKTRYTLLKMFKARNQVFFARSASC